MGVTTDTWPFVSQGTAYTLKLDYDGSGNQIYVGWAIPGTVSSTANWRIMKQVFNGSNQLTDVQWPSGSISFTFIWDSRTSYSFS